MIYLDTSVLVAALTREPATERVQMWLAAQNAGTLAISGWTHVEFAAALRFKAATGQIEDAQREAAATQFAAIAETALTTWPVEIADFEDAQRIAASDVAGLRAPDALHFAIAGRRNAVLCTLDEGLLKACDLVGAPRVKP
jgi:predicted nucleic acid-binding protein